MVTDYFSTNSRGGEHSSSQLLAARETSLRGPATARLSARAWRIVGGASLVILLTAVALSFIAAANDNARIARLHSSGLPVSVRITSCLGNLGGSGSNLASYTCQGTYQLSGVTYHEVVNGLTSLRANGTLVPGVVDPNQHSVVIAQSALATEHVSGSRYAAPTLLALAWVGLTSIVVRRWRRPSPNSSSPTS
ncbi:MAG: hypothetical protein KGR42_02125 [Acidobacteria bacterium]|nr:hypothetical protein [Acidobacteriota bacterium]